MQEQKSTDTSEMKVFGQDLLDLGVRYMKAGKAWLNYRRSEMNHDNDYGENRQQERHKQQDHETRNASRPDQKGQQRYGQYQGSDYNGPGGEAESGFGSSHHSGPRGDEANQRYSRYSQSDGYRTQGQYSQDQNAQAQSNSGQNSQDPNSRNRQRYESAVHDGHDGEDRNIRRSGDNTGRYSGYADEQDSRGSNQSGSRRNAQEQYGDPRGQGSSAQGNYGQAGHQNYGGEGTHGQSGHVLSNPKRDDSSSAKGHRGKGPRGYSRSDERLTEDLNEQLMHDNDIDASDIDVRVSSGEVTLEGTVPDRWMKHRAEDLAERCSGVKDVDNRIRVKKPDEDGRNDTSSAGMKSAGTNAADG